MAADKIVDSEKLKVALVATADTIRTKGGTTAKIAFDYDDEPTGFTEAIEKLIIPPKKTVKITNNSAKTIRVKYIKYALRTQFDIGIEGYNTGDTISAGASKTIYPASGSALLIESNLNGASAHKIAQDPTRVPGVLYPYSLYNGTQGTSAWVNTSWLVMYSNTTSAWTEAEITIIDG